jgi:hypothetical protein
MIKPKMVITGVSLNKNVFAGMLIQVRGELKSWPGKRAEITRSNPVQSLLISLGSAPAWRSR